MDFDGKFNSLCKLYIIGVIEIRTVDLFCGCGGMSLGFQMCGYEIVGAFDFWQTALDCYAANMAHPVFFQDLSKKNSSLRQIRPLMPELIIGGPPCQDFSSAGERKEGQRANLTVSYAKIIKNIRPKYFVMENVTRAKSSNAYAEAREIFKSAGYGLTEEVLDASKCGVPQKRKRFFCIGALDAPDGFLTKYLAAEQLIIPLTVREYFKRNNYNLDFDYYYRHPRSYARRAIFSIDQPAPTIRGVNRPKPPEYIQHSGDAAPPDNINALTFRQRSYIQTFPENYIFNGNQAENEQMIGNAVPVNLAVHVARALSAYIANDITFCSVAFSDWLTTKYGFTPLAVKDTISRIKRCNKMLLLGELPQTDYIHNLDEQEPFKQLTKYVRSQLKRAAILYYEYLDSKNHRQ